VKAWQKRPAIRGGRKSREVTAVRRHHNGKPIRLLEMFPSSHRSGQSVPAAAKPVTSGKAA
jgi:hypothetical protein